MEENILWTVVTCLIDVFVSHGNMFGLGSITWQLSCNFGFWWYCADVVCLRMYSGIVIPYFYHLELPVSFINICWSSWLGFGYGSFWLVSFTINLNVNLKSNGSDWIPISRPTPILRRPDLNNGSNRSSRPMMVLPWPDPSHLWDLKWTNDNLTDIKVVVLAIHTFLTHIQPEVDSSHA